MIALGSLIIAPLIVLFVGIYLLSQILIIIPTIIIACVILYSLKLLPLVPVVVLICAGLLLFGRKKVCKRCSKPEERCDQCGR